MWWACSSRPGGGTADARDCRAARGVRHRVRVPGLPTRPTTHGNEDSRSPQLATHFQRHLNSVVARSSPRFRRLGDILPGSPQQERRVNVSFLFMWAGLPLNSSRSGSTTSIRTPAASPKAKASKTTTPLSDLFKETLALHSDVLRGKNRVFLFASSWKKPD